MPELQALLHAERPHVDACLRRQPAGRVLVLRPGSAPPVRVPDGGPLELAQAWLDDGRFVGDADCAPDALGWDDETFRLVIVQHAADELADAQALADEVCRVTAIGGSVLWFGLGRWSAWRPWLHARARQSGAAMHPHGFDALRRRIVAHGLVAQARVSIGPLWPSAHSALDAPALLAPWRGAWMLQATRQRSVLTPLRPRALRPAVPIAAALALPSRRMRG